jgi:hypothetical protein
MTNYPQHNQEEAKAGNTLSGGIATSDAKHIQLHHAINTLDMVIEHATSLLNRIIDEDGQGTEPSPVPKPPSLEEVLVTAPQRIRGSADHVHALLDQIASKLF